MHRMVILRVGGKRLHLLKLIGAFIILGGALMLLSSVYKMMLVASVIQNVNMGGMETMDITLQGITITEPLAPNDFGSQLGILLVPIASIMFWAAVLIFGTVIYKSGGIMLPIEETVKELPEKKKAKKKK